MLPVDRFTSFAAANRLFDSGSKVLAAVSGGMDSVLMAHLLAAAGYSFDIAHCNFQLRGAEADAEQRFCAQLSDQLKVNFHTINFDTAAYAAQHKLSIQMAARQLRYQWFDQLSARHSYTAIALAHHQNDTIETILLNLTRGTGIAGLHGILPKSGNLVRPLLFMQREEIADLVQQNGLAYMEDSSNASTKYARNKIRHEVVPKLKELNPSLEQTFEANLQRFRELEQLLQLETERCRRHFTGTDDELRYPLTIARELDPQRLLLFSLLKPYGFNEEQVSDLISVLDKHPGRIFESATHQLILDREQLILKKKTVEQQPPVTINDSTFEVSYGAYRLKILHDNGPLVVRGNPMAVSVDAALLQHPLTLRAWQQGDHFYPLGMSGKQKLSDFFIHQKLPLHQKDAVPILVNGNGEVIWIGGQRLDERYKVSDNTKKVTIFELYNTP